MRQLLVMAFDAVEHAVAVIGINPVPSLTAEVLVILSAAFKGAAVPGENFIINVTERFVLPVPKLILRQQAAVAVGNDIEVVEPRGDGRGHGGEQHEQRCRQRYKHTYSFHVWIPPLIV